MRHPRFGRGAVFRTLVDDEIPMNAGCLKPLHIVIPEGSMLSPRYPAAVVASNVEASQTVTDALYGALGVLAASQGTMNNFTFGNDTHQYYETISGGAGAGPDFDGASVNQTHMRIPAPPIRKRSTGASGGFDASASGAARGAGNAAAIGAGAPSTSGTGRRPRLAKPAAAVAGGVSAGRGPAGTAGWLAENPARPRVDMQAGDVVRSRRPAAADSVRP
jgi:5-oxoprolinase (ATP-hydrolysing)